jgi:cell division protein ZapA
MSSNSTISVSLLDKDYQVACPPEEQEALFRAARNLDQRLRAIRDQGSIVGLERIAIMAALNLNYELQTVQSKSPSGALSEELITSLAETVDKALHRLRS